MIEIMCTKYSAIYFWNSSILCKDFRFHKCDSSLSIVCFCFEGFSECLNFGNAVIVPKNSNNIRLLVHFHSKTHVVSLLDWMCTVFYYVCVFFCHHQFSVKRFVAVVVMVVLLLILMFVLILTLQLAQKARLSIIQKLNAENNEPKNSRGGKSSMNKMHKRRKWAKVVRCGELMLIHAVHTMGKCFSLLLSTRLRFMLRFSLDELIQMNPSEKRAIN